MFSKPYLNVMSANLGELRQAAYLLVSNLMVPDRFELTPIVTHALQHVARLQNLVVSYFNMTP